jgi:hypothetical protein
LCFRFKNKIPSGIALIKWRPVLSGQWLTGKTCVYQKTIRLSDFAFCVDPDGQKESPAATRSRMSAAQTSQRLT